MKYVYGAIFTPEEDGGYSVTFPDLKGCNTCGDTLYEAISMAEDVLAFCLYGYERDHREIPEPSELGWLKTTEDQFVSCVACDTIEYQKKNNNKAVKKTLTIPEWLNQEALAQEINFSLVLQEALKQKLHIA